MGVQSDDDDLLRVDVAPDVPRRARVEPDKRRERPEAEECGPRDEHEEELCAHQSVRARSLRWNTDLLVERADALADPCAGAERPWVRG